MPPKMADHRVEARKRMRTSLKMEKLHSNSSRVQPLDSEAPAKPEGQRLSPEAVSNALRELADRFSKKSAVPEEQPKPTAGVTQLMARTAGKEDQIRNAVQEAVQGGKTQA